MLTSSDKTSENKSNAVANGMPLQQGGESASFHLEDNRPEAIVQREIQYAANKSEQVKQLKEIKALANNSPQIEELKAVQTITNYNKDNALQPNETNENWHVNHPLQSRMKAGIQLMQGTAESEKENSNSGKNPAWQHYYFNPGDSSKSEYSTQIDNTFSAGLPIQMKAQKVPWKKDQWTSTLDKTDPKKIFKTEAEVNEWEAQQAAAAVPAAADNAAADEAEVDAEAADDVADAEEAPPITIYNKMTRHYKDHKSDKLPKKDSALITYVEESYQDFEQQADDNYVLGLGDFQTKQAGGKWELRSWSIMIWGDNRIHHFGPLAQEF